MVSAEIEGATPSEKTQKFSPFALTMMVVGSMVGAGTWSLPRPFATATGVFGAIIAWLIAAGGMYTLARVFQALAERKPDLDAGVYAYAKAGFGDYLGFLSAVGYFFSACLGNTFYWVLIKSTLGSFFPIFGNGDTVAAVAVSSIGIWAFHFTVLRGVQQAATINKIVTVAKVLPIILFILILGFVQRAPICREFLGRRGHAGIRHIRSGEGYDAHHHVRLHRHRGGKRLFALCAKAFRCGCGHDLWLYRRDRADGASDAALLRGAAARRDCRLAAALDGDGFGGGGRALGSGLYQPWGDRVGARRLSGVADDRRRSPIQRGQNRRHAEDLCDREPEQGSGRRPMAQQRHRPALCHQHAVHRGRVYADAQIVHFDVVDTLSAGGRLWAADCAAR